MKTSGNTILITGGGSGIGRRLAERLHAAGNHVIIAGRRQATLDAVAAGTPGIATMTLDVTDPEAIKAGAARAIAEHPALNVLVNNAGVMIYEDLGAAPAYLGDAEAMVTTNLLGPIRLTAALLPHLTQRADAAVINVTSGLAFVPLFRTPTYSATKAALHAYTLSLRATLKGRVEVIEIAPPGVQTDLTPGQATREGYMPLEDYIDETMALLTAQPTPEEVLVERVKFLRNAEREGRFDAAMAAVNAPR